MKKMKKFLSIVICIALLCAFIPEFAVQPAQASTTVALYPEEQTLYVRTTDTIEFPYFADRYKFGSNKYAYFRYDLSSIPDNAIIDSADLSLFVLDSLWSYGALATWYINEDTWTNTYLSAQAKVLVNQDYRFENTIHLNTYHVYADLKTRVQSEVASGDNKLSFALQGGHDFIEITNKLSANPPRLTVTYSIYNPKMTGAVRNSDTEITVTLSDNCTNIVNTGSGGFTVSETGAPGTTYPVTSTRQGTSAKEVILTLADMGVSAKEGVTVTYTAGNVTSTTNGYAMLTDSTGKSIAAWDTVAPTISSGSLASDNAYMDVTLNEGVYTNSNGTGALTPADFNLTFAQNGGNATGVTITSVKKQDFATEATATALAGGEDKVRLFFSIAGGPPSGVQTVEIKPADGSSIYDKAGNAMLATQTTGVKTLYDNVPPTMVSAVRNSDTQITVTLSENCADIAKANAGGFKVVETITPTTEYPISSIAQGTAANKVVLTVADIGESGKEGITVKYTQGLVGTVDGTVKDTSITGHLLATNSTGLTIAPWDIVEPVISSGSLFASNAYVDIKFSEGAYGAASVLAGLMSSYSSGGVVRLAASGLSPLAKENLKLTFAQNGGNATKATITSVKKQDGATEGTATMLTGGETDVRVFLNILGTPSGVETVEITPAGLGSVFDKAGNVMLTAQTSGVKTLNDQLAPTMVSAVRDSDTQITVTLSEISTNLTNGNSGGFTVTEIGNPSKTYAVSSTAQAGTDDTKVVLTVANMKDSAFNGVVVTYAAGTDGTIKDKAASNPNAMLTDSTGITLAGWLSSSGSTVKVGGDVYTDAATTKTATSSDGRSEITITIADKMKDIIAEKPNGTNVAITFPGDYDINNLVLTGDVVKKMEEKSDVLDITARSSTYNLPAAAINIDNVAKNLGATNLHDIAVKITISSPDGNMASVIAKAAETNGFSIVAPSVDFSINCTYKDSTVAVTEFGSYVQSTTKLPNGITAEKITTAIMVDANGKIHHVPTKVTVVNGIYYAVVNSMISGTTTFVYHPVTFPDVEGHWAKAVVNDMGSRFIVYGYENGLYVPDGNITRAEFSAIVVRAMGLREGMGTNTFADVSTGDWYCGSVGTAIKYGLIKGYSPEAFGPNDKITREQAITITARMMNKAGYNVSLTEAEKNTLFASYKDSKDISDYAKDSVAACLKSGVVIGRSASTISPKDFLTRAETAALVQRVLSKSGLI